MVLTCCYRVAIMARSCSSLVGGGGGRGRAPGMALPVVAAVVVVVAATCRRAVVVVMGVVMGKGMIHIPIQFLDPGRTQGYV